MRIIDISNAWAVSTRKRYKSALTALTDFDVRYGTDALGLRTLIRSIPHPPVDTAIPLQWAVLLKSITASTKARGATVGFSTLQSIFSAHSYVSTLALTVLSPANMRRDNRHLLTRELFVPASENIAATRAMTGLAWRLGKDSRQIAPVLARHIRYNQEARSSRFFNDRNLSLWEKYCLAPDQCMELGGYLLWLRGGEVTSVNREDVTLCPPASHALHDLPPGVGFVGKRLLPLSKTSQTVRVDVVAAWTTSSGLEYGFWTATLLDLLSALGFTTPGDPLYLMTPDSSRWYTSRLWRHSSFFPLLREQRDAGDLFLAAYTESADPATHFPVCFYSFHTLRISARSHVARKRAHCTRKATELETNLQGRWRFLPANRAMSDLYYHATYLDRVQLTLHCM